MPPTMLLVRSVCRVRHEWLYPLSEHTLDFIFFMSLCCLLCTTLRKVSETENSILTNHIIVLLTGLLLQCLTTIYDIGSTIMYDYINHM